MCIDMKERGTCRFGCFDQRVLHVSGIIDSFGAPHVNDQMDARVTLAVPRDP